MGAHEVPAEYREHRRAYIDLVIKDMIPAVARERLAEWCDVFCEQGVFSREESREILLAARAAGMKLRIHADEFGQSGGSEVAADLGVRSADHLMFTDRHGADALAAAGVVATLLPIASFYLKLGRFAPGRMLIDRSVTVALATDVNPGGGYSPSMPFAMALACFGMNLRSRRRWSAPRSTRRMRSTATSVSAARAGQTDGRGDRRRPGDRPDRVGANDPAVVKGERSRGQRRKAAGTIGRLWRPSVRDR